MAESACLEFQHAIQKDCDATSRLQKRILKKYGFSKACTGCHAAQFGLRQGASREHTKECRATGLKLQSGVQVKTSDYLQIGTEERPEFMLLSMQLQNEMVAWQIHLTPLGKTSMIIFSSTIMNMAVMTKCLCWRVIRRSKVQMESGNFSLMKRHLVVQRGAGWNCSRH